MKIIDKQTIEAIYTIQLTETELAYIYACVGIVEPSKVVQHMKEKKINKDINDIHDLSEISNKTYAELDCIFNTLKYYA